MNMKVLNAAVTVLILVSLAAGAGLGAERERDLTDAMIADAIQDELSFDEAVPANRVDIEVKKGIATLTGRVGNLLAAERAVRIAETVRGVRSVIDRIKIMPPERVSDPGIRRRVVAALADDPATEPYDVRVRVNDGVVTLEGGTQSWQEKRLAEKVAKGVAGVVGVSNEIEVNYRVERPDEEIKDDIVQRMRWDVLVDDGMVNVKVKDGRVILEGIVGSAAEKRFAIRDAWVAGTDDVNAAGLKVQLWARDPQLRREKYTMRRDAEVKRALERALKYDPRVDAENIKVEVTGGVVTLRGVLGNLRAKRAAVQTARNTVGVSNVVSRLYVEAQKLPDQEIAETVRHVLQRNPYVDAGDVDVQVNEGVVELTGSADSAYEKRQADDVASAVHGVVKVINRIDAEVSPHPLVYDPYVHDYNVYDYEWYEYKPRGTFKKDAEILDDIKDQLWWSPFVESGKVDVEVKNGVAILTGVADSWSEYYAATQNAYDGGATYVDNQMKVK